MSRAPRTCASPPRTRIPGSGILEHRWIYDKLAVALSQGLDAAPHGVMPPRFPVFSKPIMNLRGMGSGSQVDRDPPMNIAPRSPPGISGARC